MEHHFLEEYSHSSAPEVFLGACSQRTKNIRLGHGITLMPPNYNHPARVAERIATLDLVSRGRVEWGTGESSAALELDGFGVPAEQKREQWREAVEQCANMLALDPYPGFQGRYFSMPCRNIVPKPVQRPHPPLWVACSNRETIKLAARLGIGALTFAFVDPAEAKQWVDDYWRILETECVPIGHAVNANVAMVTGFSIHPDAKEARRRAMGFRFFGYALAHHYQFGLHKPGRTDIWANFEQALPRLRAPGLAGIGTPDDLRRHLQGFADAGVDQVVFLQQGGRNRHEHICEAMQLFAEQVMPSFKEGAGARERRKQERLAPIIAAAMARKPAVLPLPDAEIPVVEALGRSIAEEAEPSGARPASLGESVRAELGVAE